MNAKTYKRKYNSVKSDEYEWMKIGECESINATEWKSRNTTLNKNR